ncbi:Fucolectin-1 [Labeo rohita]|uniref:Fucolectin-1 n=1 Tax=Labeo rohita TaxID=84645 RepID=A0ABQ8MJP0_LABRO|nr:Fucolectin-1 [Labeo rohita]
MLLMRNNNDEFGKSFLQTLTLDDNKKGGNSYWPLSLKHFPENAALWGKTSQSSIYLDSVPEFALDGLLNSWTHTNTETDPWWRVDLLKVYRVNRVTITNRPTHGWRINGAVIRIGNFLDIYNNTVCATISTLADGATDTFSCGGMKGRYMIVHIPGDQKILSLSEIGVYGYLAGNMAVDGAATQSSTFMSWFAEKAIDSNRGLQKNTSCSSTLNETNPWWRLDLRDVYKIRKVVVTNRNDCCPEQINGAEIRIGNSLENNGNDNPICAVIPAISAGESYNYSCGGMEGRYVNLIIPGDMKILTLCEVEVYGQAREKVLKQLGSVLADKGFKNVTLRWSQTPKRVIQKVNADKSHCGNGK